MEISLPGWDSNEELSLKEGEGVSAERWDIWEGICYARNHLLGNIKVENQWGVCQRIRWPVDDAPAFEPLDRRFMFARSKFLIYLHPTHEQ